MREAQNNVVVEGILKENRLKSDVSKRDGKEYIAGDLLIQVSEDNVIPVNCFANKTKRDGNPNRVYQQLEKTLQLRSLADGATTKIRINGAQLRANEFYSGDNLISGYRIQANFVNVVTKDINPTAEFEVEAYIQAIIDEVDKEGEETGRLQIKGVVPGYGGRANVLTFIVEDVEKAVPYVRKNWEVGDTVKMAGKIRNQASEVTLVKEEMEFGEDVIRTYDRVVRELIVTSGKEPYTDEEKCFDKKDIKVALNEREQYLQEMKARNEAAATTTDTKTTNEHGF